MPAASRLEREVLAWSFFVASIAAFFVAYLTGHDTLRLLLKPLPAWSLAAWVATRRSGLARPVLAGLLIGSLGDLFLETGNPSHFVPGLLAFLFGHLAYIFGFAREAPALAPLRALPFLGMVSLVMAITLPKAGPLAVPIGAYGVVIAVMMWRAAARVGGPAGALAWAGLLGATSFAFSDSMIAVNRFVQPFDGARPLILVTYWGAQALVALSVPREQVAR
ncbi:MAG: lysoplasmalogenase [Archangium sp.]|nr:lysoplasmalogenase [Archangium sp.]